MKLKIKPHPGISRSEFVWYIRALWMLNDVQLNAWNHVKTTMERGCFYLQECKGLIEKILNIFRSNTAAHIWKDFKDHPDRDIIFEATGEIQDVMEDIVRRVYECFLKIKNRFLVFNYTDFGPGDICWINADDGAVKVKVLGCRFSGSQYLDDDGDPVNKFDLVIEVVAINRDGQKYGEPFWVSSEHIARHRKEFKQ